MTKDDDLPAAPSRRFLPGHGRKTAPIGTPVQKFPIDVPAAVPPAPPLMPAKPARSERPPSSSQNTLSSPRTVGGHTARLLRGEPLDDDMPESVEPSRGARPRVQDRSARGRPLPREEEEETIPRSGDRANGNAAPALPRGGTARMDATEQPAALPVPKLAAPPPPPPQAAIPAARKAPPAAPPVPLSPEPISEDLPSTARGGSARDIYDASSRQLPGQIVAPHPAVPALPVATSVPMGEITITGSEFEQTTIPREEIESRWPFAFAVGAVSLAIGSLIPLPFRQYIVPDRSGAAGSASASASASAPAPAFSAKPIATPDLVQPTAPPLRTATAAPPSTFVPPQVGGGAATGAVRPPPFGSAKVPRPNPTTPRDIF